MSRYFLPALLAAASMVASACDSDPAPVVTTTDTVDASKDTNTLETTVTPDAGPDTKPDAPKPDVPKPDVPKAEVTDDTGGPDGTDAGPDGGQCLADSDACSSSADCCSGICTVDENAYIEGQCISPLPDGSYCEADGWCASNSCVDSQCKSSSCSAEGATCYGHASCCSAKCSVGASSLDPGVCVVPVANGQACVNDNYCVSNNCDGGICAESTCKDIDEQCNAPEDCCTGLCSFASYFGSLCVAPQPDGFSCQGPEYCESGVCENGICGTGGTCLVEDSPCDFECCEGLYCPSDFSNFTTGKCSPKEADGAYCNSDEWCASGKCFNSQCQPATCVEVEATCESDAECCTGVCNGTCQYLVGTGTACLLDKQCASKNCSDGTCGPAAVTFADVYNDVLVPKGCTSGYCHGGGGAGGGLDFSSESAAYSSLLYNSANIQACGMIRYVVPNNPEVSVMWHRVRPASLDGDDPCFEKKMPLNSEGLDPASAAIVEAWISSGASM